MYLLHPRRASKMPALCKSKALKTWNKIINYCRAGSKLIFLSSGWSNAECERRGRHRDLQTYCHSDWCWDRKIKQAELHLYSREQRQVPWSIRPTESPIAKWVASSPAAVEHHPGSEVGCVSTLLTNYQPTADLSSGCSRYAGAEEAGTAAP